MVDLAARWLGGSVMAASDESFGLKENLLVEAEPDFTPGTFDHRGEVVDGWETRRRRPGTANPSGEHDWAIVRLGAAGVIETVDVDTRFFTGNFPTRTRVQALAAPGYPRTEELVGAAWTEIVPWTDLKGDSHNLLAVLSPQRWTHVRLSAYPDGGVARLRVHGAVVPDRTLWGPSVELTSAAEGARVVSCSDAFYTSADRLLRPDRPRTMGEGWETARRRDGRQRRVWSLPSRRRVPSAPRRDRHLPLQVQRERRGRGLGPRQGRLGSGAGTHAARPGHPAPLRRIDRPAGPAAA